MNSYFRKLTENETGMDFSKIRIEAEKTARKKLCIKEKQEITLDEIYKEIELVTNVNHDIIESIKKKEEEEEIRFCTQRKVAKEIYELAKYLGKKVI